MSVASRAFAPHNVSPENGGVTACLIVTEPMPDWTRWLAPLGVDYDELVIVPWHIDPQVVVPVHPRVRGLAPAISPRFLAAQQAAQAAAGGAWQLWLESGDRLDPADLASFRSQLATGPSAARICQLTAPRSQLAGRTRVTATTTRIAVPVHGDAIPVDVIMLSYCSTREKLDMTVACLRSLHQSSSQLKFRVVLVETNTPEAIAALGHSDRLEDRAQVIYPHRPFHYNAFLQLGYAHLADAPAEYLLVANNDLLFEPGSVEPLLAALEHFPSVSPWCPEYHEAVFPAQHNPYFVGYRTSMEICGWALLLGRRLLDQISFHELFPEDFAFWFQDNYYALQLKRRGVPHALVRAAKVHHLFNQSHDTMDEAQFHEFTVGQQAVYESKTAEQLTADGIPELSVLLASGIDDRNAEVLADSLLAQATGLPVEVLWLQRSPAPSTHDVARLLVAARGRFRVHVEVGTRVPRNFIEACLRAMTNHPQAESIVLQPTGETGEHDPQAVLLWNHRSEQFAVWQREVFTAEETGELSIAILSVPQRLSQELPELLRHLQGQLPDRSAEVLVFVDNQRWTVGAKRTALTHWATGRYLTFVDDDDAVADDYVDALLDAVRGTDPPDCVVFDAWVTLNGESGRICRYGREFIDENRDDGYRRRPNHLCCWKREIVIREPFQDINWGEDGEWAARAVQHLQSQRRIERVLYHYRWDVALSATIPKRRVVDTGHLIDTLHREV